MRNSRQIGFHLIARPDVIRPLLALGLGIESRIEAPFRRGHLPFDEPKSSLGFVAPARVVGELECQQMHRRELGIVVEHLLEVRDQPVPIGRIPVITARQLVADAPPGHPVQREQHHFERVGRFVRLHAVAGVARAETSKSTGSGNLGRRGLLGLKPNPPCSASNCSASCFNPSAAAVPASGSLRSLLATLSRLRTSSVTSLAVLSISACCLVQALATSLTRVRNPDRALTIAGREIGSAKERPAVGCEEERHRPPAGPKDLKRGHVDLVDVGPLLAVNLDANEARVQCPAISGSTKLSRSITWHQ